MLKLKNGGGRKMVRILELDDDAMSMVDSLDWSRKITKDMKVLLLGSPVMNPLISKLFFHRTDRSK